MPLGWPPETCTSSKPAGFLAQPIYSLRDVGFVNVAWSPKDWLLACWIFPCKFIIRLADQRASADGGYKHGPRALGVSETKKEENGEMGDDYNRIFFFTSQASRNNQFPSFLSFSFLFFFSFYVLSNQIQPKKWLSW